MLAAMPATGGAALRWTRSITLIVLASLLILALLGYRRLRLVERRRRDIEELRRHVHQLLGEAGAGDDREWVTAVLARMATHIGASRAWLIAGDEQVKVQCWFRHGEMSAVEVQRLTDHATMHFPWRQHRILVAEGRRTSVSLNLFGRVIWHWGPVSLRMMLFRSGGHEEALIGFAGDPTMRVRPEAVSAIASLLGAVADALRRNRHEERRREQERRETLSRRMETVGAFASGMAHNLNNIITAISGFAATAELRVDPSDSVANNLADINVAVRRARALVQDVLHFGRRLQGPASTISIDRLLTETSVLLTASLPAGVTFEIEGEACDHRVRGNFGQLQQVLLNLCDNAALAMPEGGVIGCRCAVRTLVGTDPAERGALAAGSYVTIAVSDQGGGIAPAAMPRLFEPFFTTRQIGTGLGLSTARDIIAEHGGLIAVDSIVGRGSCFTIWLPLAAPAADGASDVAGNGGGERVLILNTDPSRLLTDEEIVAALGYEPYGLGDVTRLSDFDGVIDLVLVTGIDRDAILNALEAVQATRWTVPVLVAATGPGWLGVDALHYPLRAGDLSRAMSRALASLQRPAAPAPVSDAFRSNRPVLALLSPAPAIPYGPAADKGIDGNDPSAARIAGHPAAQGKAADTHERERQ